MSQESKDQSPEAVPAPGATSASEAAPPGATSASEGASGPASSSGPESTSGTAGEGARRALPLEAAATRDIVLWIVGVFGARAWQGMGLVPNPVSGKIERDLTDARIAIDAASALFEVLRPHLDEPARRETEQLLTTLRLNFVEKSAGA